MVVKCSSWFVLNCVILSSSLDSVSEKLLVFHFLLVTQVEKTFRLLGDKVCNWYTDLQISGTPLLVKNEPENFTIQLWYVLE